MVYMSAVHQYWPFSSFWAYGEIAPSLPFGVKCGHVTYLGQWNLSIPDMCKFWAEGGKSQEWFSTSTFSLSLQPVMFQMVGPRSWLRTAWNRGPFPQTDAPTGSGHIAWSRYRLSHFKPLQHRDGLLLHTSQTTSPIQWLTPLPPLIVSLQNQLKLAFSCF